MLSTQLKLSAAHLPMNCRANTLLAPLSGYAVERTQLRSSNTVSTSGVSLVRSVSPIFTLVSACVGSDCCRVLHASIVTGDTSHNVESQVREVDAHLLNELSSIEDTRVDNYSNWAKSSDSKDGKEMERRRKIGLANKGKVPWNKGRKHSAETRERIRQRTKEALSNPKVRKKMSECPRSLSNQTKAKISKSIRKLWGKRLKWKRTRQKFLQFWAESIANAAKEGEIDQQELEWDSYEKMKSEIAILEQEQAAQKAKQKEMARVRAERTAKERMERKERLAQKKKEQEEKAKLGGESKRKTRKKSKEEKEELAVTQELKLKARLMKIHKRKSILSQVSSQHQRAWNNMELTKQEESLPQVTLADQIRLAKIKRAEYMT